MIIYNVTTKVASRISEAWLGWMRQEHIPAVMATGCFSTHRLVRLLEVDEDEGPTYAIQYTAANRAAYDHYIQHFADALRKEAFEKWGQQFISFRTVMEVLD